MSFKWHDIFKLLRTILVVCLVVFCLTACASDKNGSMTGTTAGNKGGSSTEDGLTENHRACWQAKMLDLFYDTMGEASIRAYPIVTGSAMPLIMVAFSVWLSIRVLRHISSVVGESPAEVWTEVARMAGLCLFCGLLASSTSFLVYTLNTFIFPIYYTFLEFSERILSLAAEGVETKGQIIGSHCLIYDNPTLSCAAPALEKVSAEGGTFPQGPSVMMQCMSCTLSDRLQLGFEIAKNLFGQKSLTSVIAGLIIYFIFAMVRLTFVLYMIDSIFRMTIITIILPLLIIAIPFKATRKWSTYGFKVILNSAAIMMCLSVTITMSILAMQIMIQENAEEFGDNGRYQEFSIVLVALVLVSFLVMKSAGLAVAMANSLVGGDGSTDFQKKIGKLAAWVVKKLASVITAGGARFVTAVTDQIAALRKAKEAGSKAGKFLNKIAGRDKT